MSSLNLSNIIRIKLTWLRLKTCKDQETILDTILNKTKIIVIHNQMMTSLILQLLKFKYHNQRKTKGNCNRNFTSSSWRTNSNNKSWNSSRSFRNSIRN